MNPSRTVVAATAVLSLALLGAACGSNRGRLLGTGGGDDPDAGASPADDATFWDSDGPPGFASGTIIAPGTPADAPTKFGGAADPGRAPQIAYPPDGVLIPPNLNELEVQLVPKGGADLFELAFTGPYTDVKIYTVCNPIAGGGCALEPDEMTWKLLSGSGRGETLTLTVRATSQAGGGVGTAAAQKLSFSSEDMLGGLYYWAASSGGIYRYEFGRRGQKAESFYTPAQAGGVICVGCHALSRNGARMAAGLNAPTPAPTLRLLDVANRKKLFDQGGGFGFPGAGEAGSNHEALTPDGSLVITTETGGLTIRDAATGKVIGANPALPNANMPDVSPDGKTVVFARASQSCPFGFCVTLSVTGASLYTVPFTGNAFGAPRQLVSGGGNNYYPSWSPDGAFVTFNRAAGDSYDAKDSRVMVVSASGGAPVELKRANESPAGSGNSWPKWAPFLHHFRGANVSWIAWSSRRPIGLRNVGDLSACGQQNAQGCPNAQIWMVPVDMGKLAGGADPGYPAFWLPFQDAKTSNHIPQWVETVKRAPCTQIDQSACEQNEICQDGVCVPGIG